MSDPNPAIYANSLAEFLCTFDIQWDAALNALQAAGVVSDNCVSIGEVAEADCAKAIFFVNRNCKHLIERTLFRPTLTGPKIGEHGTERSGYVFPA